MAIGADTLLFFDASCLIAAAGSPTGGSGFLVSLCGRYLLRGAVSPPILVEAERNVRDKLGSAALGRYQRLIVITPFLLTSTPTTRQLARCESIVGAKDAHVLAAALVSGAPYLLTLDQRLAESINQANLGLLALSPGEFIKEVLPRHVDYPALRE